MVDFDKLFIVDEVVPVKDSATDMRIGEYVLKPKSIQLSEFDIGGVLYHANYFHLYEQARESLFVELGFPYHQFVAKGQHMAIVESEQHFLKPITYGQTIEIGMRCQELRSVSLAFAYVIYADNDEIVHRACTRHAFVSKDELGVFKPSRIPKGLAQALTVRFTSE